MKKFICIIILILALFFLYGRYIEPDNFKIKEYTINASNIPESFKDLKIVQFSDLLYNNDTTVLDKLEKEINDLEPDIIIFSGDLLNSDNKYNKDDFANLEKFLTNLNADLYKYAVYGENDQNYIETLKDILYNSNFIVLDNESTLLFYKDVTPIKIIGYSDNKANLEELLQSDVEYNYTLLITHKPDNINNLLDYNIDTVIAGHSLGGIINIPYYGGLIKMNGAKTYTDDYYKVGDTELFISNGVGYKYFEFRLFNTPSINVYRFNKK